MAKFTTAINCMDGRVQLPLIHWVKNRYDTDYVDMITVAGPNKVLSENKDKGAVESIKKHVSISIDKHSSGVLFVCGHYDCAGNPADKTSQIKQIKEAIDLIKTWDLGIPVKGVWINKDWQIEEV